MAPHQPLDKSRKKGGCHRFLKNTKKFSKKKFFPPSFIFSQIRVVFLSMPYYIRV
jgi:hypothetical protein